MFGDRYFGARYFGNRYFGPSGAGAQWAPEIDDGHDGKPSNRWEEQRQQRDKLRETIARAKRKANGEPEPFELEELPVVELPAEIQPPKPDYAGMIAALMRDAQQAAEIAVANEDEDELTAILLLAA
ncbi:hypothetical protein EOA60_18195 [Mesorhizobium sp. M1A.F.Ca.IN.020.06.1.1]|uniref:hypothetical protein n=2 Tax=Mesorhizobium TaxID=68287 RepID=UPI000FCAE7E4|nr:MULTISPECIES: hypothetical protein [unclassified Mesorhizobium]RUV90252.1 hypothetical protein EOA51_00605 [Mesorhizobium sp. M1A.F.Ca.IN.020.32.1.1]RUW12727.1 hypothetical protein EOA46_08440 [Mesorhizobium sp. M1A.F.Ca.IN.022.05.2.1]RUW27324.1 hypothetical protein EOA60_18195 [Mesorhizobium sp. M1A.F.Ca.IN.020.06.1.1]RWG04192.1 MAG: hypothetical protein EOQ38_06535 [Mesorhizobium sp.]RWG91973.1 MAG: hypothetical protein EOQ68_04600 [Mesorhizobium sp.]